MDASYLDDVIRARKLTEDQRSWETLQLIDRTRELMLAGIRMQFPEASEDEVRAILRHRYQLARIAESLP